MKASTLAIAFGPAVLALATKTALEPAWLGGVSFASCMALGAVLGIAGAIAMITLEPDG